MLSLFESWIVTEIQFYNSLQDAAPKINQELVRIVVLNATFNTISVILW